MRARLLVLSLSAMVSLQSGCVPDCAKAGTCPADTNEDGSDDTGGTASFVVTPATVDFGTLLIGDSAEQVLTIENMGDIALALELALTGEQSSAYTLTLENPVPDVGESTGLLVLLTPSNWGSHVSELVITDAVSGDLVLVPITAWVGDDKDEDGYASTESGGDDCNDGDATVNPDATETWYDGVDQDCDGGSDYDQDGDGSTVEVDCDDTDATIYPGATEVPDDDIDNDCEDGDAKEDLDGDGWSVAEGDCDDENAALNPDAVEVCDGIDNDCDDEVDEGATGTFYVDADEDGYGDSAITTEACDLPTGYAAEPGDCDDTDADYHPGATESDCTDPADYNCDGSTGYDDGDGDGWVACVECDDGDALINPAATEICDSANTDEDCSGAADDADSGVDPVTKSTWYADGDGDGYGRDSSTIDACDAPSGFVGDDTDCDDDMAAVNPGGTEICDALDTDEDCDGLVDDADTSVDLSTGTTWYTDSDGDGYGDPVTSAVFCDLTIEGAYSATDDDCDDTDPAYNPGAVEDDCTDPNDYNCDHSVGYADADGDGAAACVDCDDGDGTIHLGATEVPDDGIDQDCDGVDASSAVDLDLDGWDSSEDCDDTRAEANPGVIEEWCHHGIDADCDGLVEFSDSDCLGYPSTTTSDNVFEVAGNWNGESAPGIGDVGSWYTVSGAAVSYDCTDANTDSCSLVFQGPGSWRISADAKASVGTMWCMFAATSDAATSTTVTYSFGSSGSQTYEAFGFWSYAILGPFTQATATWIEFNVSITAADEVRIDTVNCQQ